MKVSMKKRGTKTKREVRTLRRNEAEEHFEVLNLCYEPWGDKEEWRKRYLQLPNFDVSENVVVVEENGKWAGGGTAWLREALLTSNKRIKVYEAGDLYVHPNFRGKGIYSTAMQSLNEFARERGAALGFAFPSILGVAVLALPKYGFADVFHPVTKIFLLNPGRFVDYLFSRAQFATVPQKFEGIKVKLVVSFVSKKKDSVTRVFVVRKGQLQALSQPTEDLEKVDLTVKTSIEMLVKMSSLFYRGKKTLFVILLPAMLRRHLSFRFSLNFVKALVGLR